jgi:hypothetical protein
MKKTLQEQKVIFIAAQKSLQRKLEKNIRLLFFNTVCAVLAL